MGTVLSEHKGLFNDTMLMGAGVFTGRLLLKIYFLLLHTQRIAQFGSVPAFRLLNGMVLVVMLML